MKVSAATTANHPPTTPQTGRTIKSSFHTPPSGGTSSKYDSDDPKKHTKEEYNMFLKTDWEKKKTIRLSAFCNHLLRISFGDEPDEFSFDTNAASRELRDTYSYATFDSYAPSADLGAAQEIIKEADYVKLKQAYKHATKTKYTEPARYAPFIELVNYIIESLRSRRATKDLKGKKKSEDSNKLVFVRNDPKVIKGSKAIRSPDVIAIREGNRVVNDINRALTWSTKVRNNPHGFYWPEMLFFVEFEGKANMTRDTDPNVVKVVEGSSKGGSKVYSMKPSGTSNTSKKRRADGEADPSYASSTKRPRKEVRASEGLTMGQGSGLSEGPSEGPFHLESNIADEVGEIVDEPIHTKRGLGYRLKCAGYALEMFTNGGLRTFVLSLLINGSSLEICSYQRSKIILAEAFNFLEEDEIFIAIIESLMIKEEDSQLGISDLFRPPSTNYAALARPTDLLIGATYTVRITTDSGHLDVPIRFTEVLYFQRALLSRGSFVVKGLAHNCPLEWRVLLGAHMKERVLRSDVNKLEVILKASSLPRTRKTEQEFIQTAKECAIKAKLLWVLVRMPTVLHAETKMEMNEHELRTAFALAAADPDYEIRELRVLVLAPLLPVTKVTSAYELVRIYIDFVQVHKFLVQSCNILHRDISLNNLMYRVKIVGGVERKYGVINDFDLAAFMYSDEDTNHQQRTGTLPFMAYELLQEYEKLHLPRHDLESIFYTLLIIQGAETQFA